MTVSSLYMEGDVSPQRRWAAFSFGCATKEALARQSPAPDARGTRAPWHGGPLHSVSLPTSNSCVGNTPPVIMYANAGTRVL